MRRIPVLALVTSGFLACENPTEPARLAESSEQVKVASPEAGTQAITLVSGNGPIGSRSITAHRNLDVTLRGAGEGAIKFRQPRDADYIVYLRTRVSGLAPNTDYQLQRATDPVVDDNCTSHDWLTLGRLDAPKVIHTDGQGQGAANFTRDLSGVAGGEFDIRFRVRNAVTGAVVLRSGCYQFKVRQ